jgi:Domain of unknown function (DUF5679)
MASYPAAWGSRRHPPFNVTRDDWVDAAFEVLQPRICLSGMVERSSRHSEAQDPGPQAWCVCGEKVTIADAREVTLPNGRPGWEGYCPECGGPLFGIRRKPADG